MTLKLTLILGITASALYAQNPMIVPPALDGGTYQLTLQTGTHEFYPGITSNTMGVNGSLLGPTLIMEAGENVDVTFDNQLGETTTIHWHGMHVSAENDGGPHTVIHPGTTWNPQFTILDKAATYWYHPHLHEKTNEHVLKGIAGFVIVQDSEEAALDLPRTYGVDDIPVALQTKAINPLGQIEIETEMDTSVLANGTTNAYLDLPAQIVRLRLLNGASQRAFNISLSNGASFYQIGSDGGLLTIPVTLNELLIAPGERVEILLDLNGMSGQNFSVLSAASNIPNNIHGSASVTMGPSSIPGYNGNPLNGNDFTLFSVNVIDQTTDPVTSIPSSLVSITPLIESDADVTRNLTLSPLVMGPTGMVNGPFVIDGTSFDMNVINQTVNLGDTEIWSIFNQSGVAHPFHIHDVQFQILDEGGVAPPPSRSGWKDVVLIRNMQTVRFITRFEDFADDDTPYMYHCHMLTHEDEGMMGQFLVVDNQTEVSELNPKGSIKVYPNPVSNNEITVRSYESGLDRVEVYSLEGRLVKTQTIFGKTQASVGLPETQGGFILKIVTMNQHYAIEKVLTFN
jgi:bilirubin oxidase